MKTYPKKSFRESANDLLKEFGCSDRSVPFAFAREYLDIFGPQLWRKENESLPKVDKKQALARLRRILVKWKRTIDRIPAPVQPKDLPFRAVKKRAKHHSKRKPSHQSD